MINKLKINKFLLFSLFFLNYCKCQIYVKEVSKFDYINKITIRNEYTNVFGDQDIPVKVKYEFDYNKSKHNHKLETHIGFRYYSKAVVVFFEKSCEHYYDDSVYKKFNFMIKFPPDPTFYINFDSSKFYGTSNIGSHREKLNYHFLKFDSLGILIKDTLFYGEYGSQGSFLKSISCKKRGKYYVKIIGKKGELKYVIDPQLGIIKSELFQSIENEYVRTKCKVLKFGGKSLKKFKKENLKDKSLIYFRKIHW